MVDCFDTGRLCRSLSPEPLSKRTIHHLLRRAAEGEALAASATMQGTAEALRRLAAQFRETARRRVGTLVQQAGNQPPSAASTSSSTFFGTPTETAVHVERDEPLPAAPRGFTWRLSEER